MERVSEVDTNMSEFAITLSSGMFSQLMERQISAPVVINDDAILLNRFMGGDDTAFAELFDRHHHKLYLYCLKLVGSSEQAEDLMQELWERVIKLKTSPQRVQNPGGFFATIARNLCFNHLKMRRRRTFLNTFIRQDDRTEQAEGACDLEALVGRCMEKLTLEYREVLVLQIYCDYEYGEIASMLGLNVTAVRMRASRARAQLRKLIEEHLDRFGGAEARRSLERYLAEDGGR